MLFFQKKTKSLEFFSNQRVKKKIKKWGVLEQQIVYQIEICKRLIESKWLVVHILSIHWEDNKFFVRQKSFLSKLCLPIMLSIPIIVGRYVPQSKLLSNQSYGSRTPKKFAKVGQF
jgi:hypothetical protein